MATGGARSYQSPAIPVSARGGGVVSGRHHRTHHWQPSSTFDLLLVPGSRPNHNIVAVSLQSVLDRAWAVMLLRHRQRLSPYHRLPLDGNRCPKSSTSRVRGRGGVQRAGAGANPGEHTNTAPESLALLAAHLAHCPLSRSQLCSRTPDVHCRAASSAAPHSPRAAQEAGVRGGETRRVNLQTTLP